MEESATWRSFYAEGGLEFFLEGHSPSQLEILASGRYAAPVGGHRVGPELITEVPLNSTVAGAPYTSFKTINAQWGSAFKPLHGPVVYYMRVPNKCPKEGFPFKTEVTFYNNMSGTGVTETVTATYTAPCPHEVTV